MVRTLLSVVALVGLVTVPNSIAASQTSQTKAPAGPASKPAVASAVNINTASAADLITLPGIGAKTAARILEYRQKNGPFKKVEELMNVRGVGEKSFLKLRSQISVGPAKTTERGSPQQ